MNKKNIHLAALAACSLLPVNMSYASNANTQIETITVLGTSANNKANLAGINLKDLPLNAHVVGRTEIERIRFVDPDELLDRIPGETQVRNLRIPNGGKSYTLAFVDGVPIESPYEGATQRLDRVNTFDIQRIEVIKGQVSALYPNNVFGGVVNVITRDIPKTPHASISAEAGNFNRQRFSFNLGSAAGNSGVLSNVSIIKSPANDSPMTIRVSLTLNVSLAKGTTFDFRNSRNLPEPPMVPSGRAYLGSVFLEVSSNLRFLVCTPTTINS
jgi:outer membrane cobalamin receptor